MAPSNKASPPAKDSKETKAATSASEEKSNEAIKKVNAAIMLEEDDEFEDFPADAWEESEEDQTKTHQWEDTWADDDEQEDLAVQLEAEYAKRTSGQQPMKM